MQNFSELLKIVALAVAAAVAYGVVHDQITARICVEYFTVGHPPVFATHSPMLLALGWGIVATWWVGVLLGVPAACLARSGSTSKLVAGDLVRPLLLLLCAMAVAATAAGIAGYVLASAGYIHLGTPLDARVPAAKHALFFADAAAHLASYGVGFVGGAILCGWIWRTRRRLNAPSATGVSMRRMAQEPLTTA